MQSLPAQSIFDGVKTRFDDFQALHINMTLSIHYVVCGVACIRLMAIENEGFQGQFLPWHRRFIIVFESVLRDECNYTGTIPYVFMNHIVLVIHSRLFKQILGLDERC